MKPLVLAALLVAGSVHPSSAQRLDPSYCGQLSPDRAAWSVRLNVLTDGTGRIVVAGIDRNDEAYAPGASMHGLGLLAVKRMLSSACDRSIPRHVAPGAAGGDFDMVFRGN